MAGSTELATQLRITLEKFEVVLGALVDAIVFTDDVGRVQWSNSVFDQLVNRPHLKVVGARLIELLPLGHQGQALDGGAHPVDLVLRAQRIVRQSYEFRQHDQHLVLELVGARAELAQHGTVAVFVIRDVTERQGAEEALRHTHARTEKLLSSITSILIWVDPSGRITHWNSIAETTFGITATDVVNQPLATCGIQWDSATVLAGITECRGAYRPIRLDDVRFQRADGEQGYLGFTLVPVRAEREDALEVLLFGAEITERKRVDAMLRRQAALTQLLQTVAVSANQASTLEEAIKVCVGQVCASTSWPIGQVYLTSVTGELMLTKIRHLNNARQDEAFQKMIQTVGDTPGVGLPRRVLATKTPAWGMNLTQDTDVHWAAAAQEFGIQAAFAFPVLVGQEVVAVLEFFSLEAREPDAQFLDVMANIGTQLGRVVERQRANEEIRASNKRLKELAALKDEFVAKVSHELRTPLTSIKEGLSLFLDNALGETTAEQQDFLKTIDQDIDRLAELINNMLDISKIEAGRMQLLRQRTDLGSLIDQVIQSYQPILGHRTVRRVGAEVPPVFADAPRITQVFTNLFSNAVKFTPDDGVVTFRLDHQDGMVVVAVEDTGPGIVPEELPKLFQKFSQVGLRGAGRPRGTGLGLVICKELVELHKGRIDVASVVGRGTTFRIGLPVYTDQFALTESFNEVTELAAASGEPEVAVIAIQAEALRESGAGEALPWSRLEAVAEDVRHHVHRRDLVLTVAPSWVVLLAATDAQGTQAIVGRLRGVLRDGQRLSFGTAVSPEDGADAMALFAKAANALELRATAQDGAG